MRRVMCQDLNQTCTLVLHARVGIGVWLGRYDRERWHAHLCCAHAHIAGLHGAHNKLTTTVPCAGCGRGTRRIRCLCWGARADHHHRLEVSGAGLCTCWMWVMWWTWYTVCIGSCRQQGVVAHPNCKGALLCKAADPPVCGTSHPVQVSVHTQADVAADIQNTSVSAWLGSAHSPTKSYISKAHIAPSSSAASSRAWTTGASTSQCTSPPSCLTVATLWTMQPSGSWASLCTVSPLTTVTPDHNMSRLRT